MIASSNLRTLPRRSIGWGGTLLAAAFALSGFAFSATGTLAARAGDEDVEHLVRSLHETGNEASFRRATRGLGPEAVGPLIEAFLVGEPLAPGLPTGHDELLLESLRRHGTAEVFASVEPLASRESHEPARLLPLLAEFGPSETLSALFEYAQTNGERTGNTREFDRALRSSAQRVLERHSGAYYHAHRLLSELEPEYANLLLGGIADTGSPDAIELLALFTERDGDLGSQALSRLSGAVEAGRAPYSSSVASDLRRLLNSDDPHRLTAALRALAALEDRETLPLAIDLLEHPSSQVSRAAAAALPRIAGTTLPPDPTRWEAWHNRELDWWDLEAPDLRDALWGGTPEEVLGAVGAVVLHPLFRHELALDLLPLLSDPEERVRRLAAGALAQLASASAVEELLAAGAASQGEEARVYQSALQKILGKPKPTDPLHWSLVWSTPARTTDVR